MPTNDRERLRSTPGVHVPVFDTAGAVEQAKEHLTETKVGIPWGLTDLDAATGGVRRGYYVTIGARTGNGKTTFLVNWLDRLHESGAYKVAYLGTEMDPSVLYRKWVAMRLGYDEDAVLGNEWHRLPEGAQEAVARELERFREAWRTWLAPVMSPRMKDVQETIRHAVEYGYDILILDHLHRILPEDRQSEREALTKISVDLKNAAVEHGLAVVVAAQMRREEHGVFDKYRPPHQGSFMGSSAIESNSDVALGLFRPLKPMTVKEERAVRNGERPLTDYTRPNTMAVKLLKHRFRGSLVDRVIYLHCDGSRISNHAWDEVDDDVPF